MSSSELSKHLEGINDGHQLGHRSAHSCPKINRQASEVQRVPSHWPFLRLLILGKMKHCRDKAEFFLLYFTKVCI